MNAVSENKKILWCHLCLWLGTFDLSLIITNYKKKWNHGTWQMLWNNEKFKMRFSLLLILDLNTKGPKNHYITYRFSAGTSNTTMPIKLSNWTICFLTLGLPQMPNMYKYTGCYWKVQSYLYRFWQEMGHLNLIEWFRGPLMSHTYESPVEIEEELLDSILFWCVNIRKVSRHICARTQHTLCLPSGITKISQAASSTAVVNYSTIFRLKFTTINVF
jgi:hypothetical protein